MTKKTVVETVYEYNSEGKMVKKTMTETVEYDSPYFHCRIPLHIRRLWLSHIGQLSLHVPVMRRVKNNDRM